MTGIQRDMGVCGGGTADRWKEGYKKDKEKRRRERYMKSPDGMSSIPHTVITVLVTGLSFD